MQRIKKVFNVYNFEFVIDSLLCSVFLNLETDPGSGTEPSPTGASGFYRGRRNGQLFHRNLLSQNNEDEDENY